MDELVKAFSLERVGKSGSRFDPEKTKWFNHQYLVAKSDEELAELFLPLLREKGIEASYEMTARICGMVKERCNFVPEIWEQSYFFFEAPNEYDEKVVKKRWKEGAAEMMTEIADFLETVERWKAPEIKEPFSTFVNEKEWGFGAVMNAFRLCLVGGGFGPDLFEICELIGKEETIRRIRNGVANISQ